MIDIEYVHQQANITASRVFFLSILDKLWYDVIQLNQQDTGGAMMSAEKDSMLRVRLTQR